MTYEERKDRQELEQAERALTAARKMYEGTETYASRCRLEKAEERYAKIASRVLLPA